MARTSINLDEKLDIEGSVLEMIQETIMISKLEKGPVHINIPFDEPLYETVTEILALKPVLIDM